MAEPNHIIGSRDTLAIEQSQRIPDVDDKLFLLEPGESPLTAFLTQIGKINDGGGKFKGMALQKRVVYNPEFTEYEDQYSGVWAQINNGAGYSSGATALVVDNPSAAIFSKFDLIKNTRTGEIMRVTAVDYSTQTLTVTRGAGATAAAAINDNDWLLVIGPAFEEGSKSGDSNTTKLVKVTNYTQIFKTKFGVTQTENASKLYLSANPGGDLRYLRAKYGIEQAKKMERAYWFNEKKEVTGPDGKPLRLTGGILEAIIAAGNVQDEAASALTETEFRTFLQNYAFKYGSSEKYFFCGNIVLGYLESFAASKLYIVPSDKTYGVEVRKYQSSFGTLNIIRHPMFENQYAGIGVVLDLSTIKHCTLNGRDTLLETNIQDNDADEEVDQYKTEAGLQRVNFEKNALLKGVV
ncbi:MAG: hypothetical protein UU11_C0012G0005 [Parcubacteria group bacterium GW2011_GWF2_40_69]|nr:MAG: hypothetical protein UT49_C0002G0052 [Parcubacteria group bacterium GW2011_GWF1_39_37]KKR52107.1 MAG: hypothetical protein UT89_C0003G0043 [Parcubacteria group bacterium GW2011_GWE1_40_20]KKR68436.1 MAG: hypothetical protein UU11_C0012G0005 [Parcubacteria group bacterium GW2011_GWF2_40_69]KKS35561.1 MAG: hypothetical protein UU99_C0007G0005 [Parcubacteria group bacterium GW2011_GWE2_42_14]HBD24457.1 hypothetical protein [Candidatus Zambryskibacteria bacterium]